MLPQRTSLNLIAAGLPVRLVITPPIPGVFFVVFRRIIVKRNGADVLRARNRLGFLRKLKVRAHPKNAKTGEDSHV